MRSVCKAFGAVHALRGVTLRLMPGDILGLVGDNSAALDAGKINGALAHFRSHDDSHDADIAIISQDFAPRGNMDLAQTIFLGRWPQRACSLTVATSMQRRMQCWRVSRSRSCQKVESLSAGPSTIGRYRPCHQLRPQGSHPLRADRQSIIGCGEAGARDHGRVEAAGGSSNRHFSPTQ